MYNTLAPIVSALGDNIGSICSFQYAPKEWLADNVIINKLTGSVVIAPSLIPGKAWLQAECLYKTCEYNESDKKDRPGNYMEGILSGTVLKDDKERHASMMTHRYHEFVVIYKDNNGNRRIIGNKIKGMEYSNNYGTGKEPKDASAYTIAFVHQMADNAPFYEAP